MKSKLNSNSGVHLLSKSDFSNNFVSIAVQLDEYKLPAHSGLLIHCSNKVYFFHYFDDISIEIFDVDTEILKEKNIYINKLDIIHHKIAESFLWWCQQLNELLANRTPKYGFVFDNSFYDINKKKFLVNAKHDITTCVGFCIKVIRGFLANNPEYLKLTDWTIESLGRFKKKQITEYFEKYAKSEGIKIEEFYNKCELKRITPSEIITSGFFKDLPIRKKSIEEINQKVEEIIKETEEKM